jgi:hypothetical protein
MPMPTPRGGWSRWSALAVQEAERVAHLQRALDARDGVVRLDHGRAPEGHDAVAHELVEGAAVLEDRLDHLLEVLVQHLDEHLRRLHLAHRGEAADVAVEDGALLDALAAGLHLELAADHALGEVRREQPAEALAGDDLGLDLLAEDVHLDEHRGLRGDRRDELEVLGLELGERLGVEPQHAEHVVVVEERRDDGGADPVQDHALALGRGEIHRGVVREDGGALLHDVVQDGGRDADGRGGAVAALHRAGRRARFVRSS